MASSGRVGDHGDGINRQGYPRAEPEQGNVLRPVGKILPPRRRPGGHPLVTSTRLPTGHAIALGRLVRPSFYHRLASCFEGCTPDAREDFREYYFLGLGVNTMQWPWGSISLDHR